MLATPQYCVNATPVCMSSRLAGTRSSLELRRVALLLGNRGAERLREVLAGQLLESAQLVVVELIDVTGQHRIEILVVEAEAAVIASLLYDVADEPGITQRVDPADQIAVLGDRLVFIKPGVGRQQNVDGVVGDHV